MITRSMHPLLLLALLPALAGACRPAASAGAAAKDEPTTVVAEVAGERITLAQVDARAAARLERLRDEQYEIRRQALDELISERLLEREAKARGVTRDALVKAEVLDRARVASPQEMQAIYDRNRSRLGGQTFEQVRPHIERSLREQAQAEREAAFHRELRARGEVKVALAQPRVQVAVPDDAPALGPAHARVTVVEFLDYQCPYCHRAQEVVDQVLQRYEGKVRFVHRDYLIGQPRSLPAARAARCAGEQGRFWEYHRSLLTAPGDMSDADLGGRATALGLDAARFAGCVASDRHDAAIRKAAEAGQALGITGTPTFFVNGRRLVGVRPFEEFQELIDAELKS